MRIRRKKHLKERILAVSDYVIVADRDIVNVKEAIMNKKYFDYFDLFGNNNPVELEIGCGKGKFIIEKAKNNPNINYIAVELLENIIVMAAEKAKALGLKNLKFFNSGAEYLQRYIKDGDVDNIYLNFSPPYPQKVYESRRLTSPRLVVAYKAFLRNGGAVYQKTDDKDFFEYSFEKFLQAGFNVEDVSLKLKEKKVDNIETEYEQKFLALGLEVYGLIARKND